MATPTIKTVARLISYLALGGLGAIALVFPLFGVLAYLAVFLLPALFAWVMAGAAFALRPAPRLSRVYLLANGGILAATVLVMAASDIRVALGAPQPNTNVTAPLYLGLVLAGLIAGLIVGARWHPESTSRDRTQAKG